MGPFPDVVSCQIAVTPPFDRLGGTGPHADGRWGGAIPSSADEIDPVKGGPLDAARYFGENDDRRGTNDGTLWPSSTETMRRTLTVRGRPRSIEERSVCGGEAV